MGDVMRMSIKDMIKLITSAGLSFADCIEKPEIQTRALEAQKRLAEAGDNLSTPPAAPEATASSSSGGGGAEGAVVKNVTLNRCQSAVSHPSSDPSSDSSFELLVSHKTIGAQISGVNGSYSGDQHDKTPGGLRKLWKGLSSEDQLAVIRFEIDAHRLGWVLRSPKTVEKPSIDFRGKCMVELAEKYLGHPKYRQIMSSAKPYPLLHDEGTAREKLTVAEMLMLIIYTGTDAQDKIRKWLRLGENADQESIQLMKVRDLQAFAVDEQKWKPEYCTLAGHSDYCGGFELDGERQAAGWDMCTIGLLTAIEKLRENPPFTRMHHGLKGVHLAESTKISVGADTERPNFIRPTRKELHTADYVNFISTTEDEEIAKGFATGEYSTGAAGTQAAKKGTVISFKVSSLLEPVDGCSRHAFCDTQWFAKYPDEREWLMSPFSKPMGHQLQFRNLSNDDSVLHVEATIRREGSSISGY